MGTRPAVARELFAPVAPTYERWARLMSLGQDGRWRRMMVAGLDMPPGSLVLDLAAGTGSISRVLSARGHRVVATDQSAEMLGRGRFPGAAVQAEAEVLPFADAAFDAVTFGYLLRYVDDVAGALGEIVRVLRPGGVVGMVEFGRPNGPARLAWEGYTRVLLPAVGVIAGRGWRRVGRFLGPSITEFSRRLAPHRLAEAWRGAGLVDVTYRRPSLGGGLVMWGRKP
jgi:demethylmenaquinone methyltransferase / 2-methoxy-6-polyprenyl-1,4-benzoquinol methylase